MENKTTFRSLGSTSALGTDRADFDFYATPRDAVEKLLKAETFSKHIIEPFAGNGHISNVLKERGFDVYTNDIIQREEPLDSIDDVFNIVGFNGDCITNPPYKNSVDYVLHCLQMCKGHKCAFLMKLIFLEGRERYDRLFSVNPPQRIYVFIKRISCAKNGNFENHSGVVVFAWFVWDNDGTKTEPIVRWI